MISFNDMENKIVKVTYRYIEPEDEKYDEENDEYTNEPRVCIVTYKFTPSTKNLVVSVEGGNSVTIDKMDERDLLDDVSIKICGILPKTLNNIGAPISLIESFILDEFLKDSPGVDKLNNSVFDEDEFELTLSSGKVISLPTTGSSYFDLSLDRLL